MNVKEHVENNQKVTFQFYRSGVLYYKTEKGLIFEVPITDCGDAVFNREDKAMYYMRWIRKQIEAINGNAFDKEHPFCDQIPGVPLTDQVKSGPC